MVTGGNALGILTTSMSEVGVGSLMLVVGLLGGSVKQNHISHETSTLRPKLRYSLFPIS
jgi:hypothetical protein